MSQSNNSVRLSELLASSGEEPDPFETLERSSKKEGISRDTLMKALFLSLMLGTHCISLVWICTLQNQVNSMSESLKNGKIDLGMVELQSILNSSNFIPRNCHDYNIKHSGYYTIDPKKQNGRSSKMKVYCDHQKQSSEVYHDLSQEITVPKCTSLNCFQINLTYDTSMENIKSLIDVSEECYQEISFECYLSKITEFASFRDRNGVAHKYFHENETTNCLCHEENSCFSVLEESKNRCNCDLGDTFQRRDVIPIRNKDVLPITSFLYGLMHQPEQSAKVKIGPLICKGVRPMPYRSIVGDSCESLMLLGQPPGFYILPGKFNFEVTFCDMLDKGTEIRLILHEEIILDDEETVELNFNKTIIDGAEKEGLKLKAPKSGIYKFNISFPTRIGQDPDVFAVFQGHVSHYLDLQLNGVEIYRYKTARHLKENENMVFTLSCKCFSYNPDHDKLPKGHPEKVEKCSVPCSEEKPCEISIIRPPANVNLANVYFKNG